MNSPTSRLHRRLRVKTERTPSRRPRQRARSGFRRLLVEQLEARQLLTGSISGHKFNDLDGDGVRGANEPGLAGWTIYLDENKDGVLNDASSTNELSSTAVPKEIKDLSTVTSKLAVTNLSGPITDVDVTLDITHGWDSDLAVYLIGPSGTRVELFTNVDAGGDDFTDTRLDDDAAMSIVEGNAPFTGRFRPEGLLSALDGGDPNGTWQLEIKDQVSDDEGWLNSWSITLTTLVTIERHTQTLADGSYEFTNLLASTYTIREVEQSGWTQTYPATGAGWSGDDAVDLSDGEVVTGVDFGNHQPPGRISGQKWNDLDSDGTKDTGEPGLGGWTIYADLNDDGQWDGPGSESYYAETDASGNYAITDLPPGAYQIREVLQAGWEQTFPNSTSDPSGLKNAAHTVLLTSGQAVAGKDFGNSLLPGEISGVKWNDRDGDRIQDTNEPGLEGWEIYIDLNDNAQRDTGEPFATTGADGSYTIAGVPPGNHTVREVLQPGWTQTYPGTDFATPELNFDGQGFTGVQPPDTAGDAGMSHYVQATNDANGTTVTVYNKADGTVAVPPFGLSSLAAGANGGSPYLGSGYPTVLYDQFADRWLIMELEISGNELEIFISDTGDPTSHGADWTQYRVNTPFFADYPKITVWPDAYFIGTYETDALGDALNPVYALDRNAMLAGGGGLVTAIRQMGTDRTGWPFAHTMPVDLDGPTLPRADEPGIFLRQVDDELTTPGGNDPANDFLELWEFKPDFANPANSSYTLTESIPISEFTLVDLSWDDISQPGTPQLLDALDDVIMWRPQYRNFGTYATIVGNFTVDDENTGVGQAGVRWFELRKGESGAWVLHQEGTYAPDGENRWTGAIAMDGAGNIALGYNVSSSTVYPGIRYAGRLASDPLGTLPRGEYTLIAGEGSQTGTNRWGDYSAMSVDPGDDSTFWFTGEYLPANGDWATRIGVFAFESAAHRVQLRPGESIADVNFGNRATPPAVSVTVAPESVAENGSENLVYTFTRTNTDGGRLTVAFTVGGTATFDADYTVTGAATFTPSHGTVTFTAGSDTATVIVDPTADTIVESDKSDETVILTLVPDFDYNAGDPSAATGTIINADLPPGEISGLKWNDRDGDRVRDTNEPGLEGWEVYVDLNDNGAKDSDEPSDTTDADGRYTIADVPPGDYKVREVLQSGWEQTYPGTDFAKPELNFDGQSFSNMYPPDTVGDVGVFHYVQATNGNTGTLVKVYNKANGTVADGPFNLSSLAAGAIGGSPYVGRGDPIVLYDQLADRWLLMELESAGKELNIFLSDTGDPTSHGADWTQYRVSAQYFPDYPKITLWPEAYLIGTNEPDNPVYALDRKAMLEGGGGLIAAVRERATDRPNWPSDHTMPVDLDGPTPPRAGEPGIFLRQVDDELTNTGGNDPANDFLELWEFKPDFVNPANSSYVLAESIPIAGFTLVAPDISQPGTAQLLDAQDAVMMWRPQYRNFGTYETIVGNFTVDDGNTGEGQAGIRWFELRKGESGVWTLHQEGTYAPDAEHRWMGAIAMDGAGNIALGYNVSSSTVYPGIRYVGRLASDPLGTLPRGEHTLIAGQGSQTNINRWGDYSAMSVDPWDDSTFWFTGEYLPTGGNWATQIGAFAFAVTSHRVQLRPGGAITNLDFGNKAAPPAVSVTVAPESVTENGTENLVYTFTRTNTDGGRLTVDFTVSGGAEFNPDYTKTDYTVRGASTFAATRGTVTFAAGSDTATVIVDPMEDTKIESDETVILTVVPDFDYIAGDPSAATGTITNVEFAKFWVVDDRADDVFRYRADPLPQDLLDLLDRKDVAPQAQTPRGVATTVDGSRMWVLDEGKVVYVYDGDGAVLGSWLAPQLQDPTGIATSGNDIWIVDKGTDSVYRFAGAAGLTSAAELNTTLSFPLNEENASPEGIATDGTTLWVINGEKQDRVFVYETSGKLNGSWSIDTANGSPTGIAIDPAGASQSIWIVDIIDGCVYEYDNARSLTSGSRSAKPPFALVSANGGPHDIAVRGINIPPRLIPVGAPSIVAGVGLSLALTAVDETLPAGALVYAAAGLPPGAEFDPAAGGFHWVPAASQAPASYRVTFSVSDGLAIDSQEVVITVLAPNPWQNRSNPADVDGNGRVSPLDVLVLINYVNRFGSGPLPAYQPGDPYCDVSGDGEAGPIDSLLVINYLNAGAEAESESAFSAAVAPFRVGTFGQILPEGTATASTGFADDPGLVAGSSPPALGDWSAAASHVRGRASASGQDGGGAALIKPEPSAVRDRVRTGERLHASRVQERIRWAVNDSRPLQSSDELGEDLLTVLATHARFAWRAAADDLFSDLGSLEHSCNRPA
jgi:subtilisin-like proprotein convertase family protein